MGKYNFPKRFQDKIHVTETCWLWLAYRDKDGYGRYRIGSRTDNSRKQVGAHVFSWEHVNGKLPIGFQINHQCDNPQCVNPEHLAKGTAQSNMREKVLRNRSAYGEYNGRAKLTQVQADEIRSLYSQGLYAHRKLAKMFDVSPTLILNIINNKNWVKKETCLV